MTADTPRWKCLVRVPHANARAHERCHDLARRTGEVAAASQCFAAGVETIDQAPGRSAVAERALALLAADPALAGIAVVDAGLALMGPGAWHEAFALLRDESAHGVVAVHRPADGQSAADCFPPFDGVVAEIAGLPHGGLIAARRDTWLGGVAEHEFHFAPLVLDWPASLDLLRTPALDDATASMLLARHAHCPPRTHLRLVVFDIDGVMTDAGFYFDENKQALKKFSTRDGQGLVILRDLGIHLGIITGERTGFAQVRARGLQIDRLAMGTLDKLPVLDAWRTELGLAWNQIAYMGDDLPDLPCLRRVGVAACPADAEPEVRAVCHFIAQRPGGRGAVRDFVRHLVVEGHVDTRHAPAKVRVFIDEMMGRGADSDGVWPALTT